VRNLPFANKGSALGAALVTIVVFGGGVTPVEAAGSPTNVSEVTLSASDVVLDRVSGHSYAFVAGGFTWTSAIADAKRYAYAGEVGHVLTISNAEENDFVTQYLSGRTSWLAAKELGLGLQSTRTWKWIDGPMSGQIITTCTTPTGGASCDTPTGAYTNWVSGEPNNALEEYAAHINCAACGNGKWNDWPQTTLLGYVVQFDASGPPFISSVTKSGLSLKVAFNVPTQYNSKHRAVPVDRIAYSIDGGAWVMWGYKSKGAQFIQGLKRKGTYSIRIMVHGERGHWSAPSEAVSGKF
jgi:hypothetical protein